MSVVQGAPITKTVDWTVAFDDLIDCRSPAEFEHDHIPGAINCWSLDNQQRALVGTVYVHEGAFAGRRLGARLVSANIARHLSSELADKPKNWRPLVYCWRGGQRSGAMATVLGQIGYRVTLLDGGYKAYRHRVLADLASLCTAPRYLVLSGRTGVGKTKLLEALRNQGEQVLDLEGLASHRGSLFGALGLGHQPSPPMFDSLLFRQLSSFDPSRPVWVEAESAKIGELHLPQALINSMRRSPTLEISASLDDRIQTILTDYDANTLVPDQVLPLIDSMPSRVGQQARHALRMLAMNADWRGLTRALIEIHYDPSYGRSITGHYRANPLGEAMVVAQGFDQAASDAIAIARRHF